MTNLECASGQCEVVGTHGQGVEAPVLFEPVSSVAEVKPITDAVRGAFDGLQAESGSAVATPGVVSVTKVQCSCPRTGRQFYQVEASLS